MKKIISLITMMTILIACIGNAYAAGNATVTVGNVEAKPGDAIKVDVTVSESAYAAYGFRVVYDTEILTLDSVDQGEMSQGVFGANTTSHIVSAFNPTDYSGSGVMFTLNFTISDSATDGEYEIDLISDGIVDASNTELSVTVQAGCVTVNASGLEEGADSSSVGEGETGKTFLIVGLIAVLVIGAGAAVVVLKKRANAK